MTARPSDEAVFLRRGPADAVLAEKILWTRGPRGSRRSDGETHASQELTDQKAAGHMGGVHRAYMM